MLRVTYNSSSILSKHAKLLRFQTRLGKGTSLTSLTQTRTLSIWDKVVRGRIRNEDDGVDDRQILIYKNNSFRYMHSGCVVLGACLPLVLLSSAKVFLEYAQGTIPPIDELEHPVIYAALCSSFGLFLVGAAQLLRSRAMSRIYYNEDTNRFTGICYNWYLAKKRLSFSPDECVRRDFTTYTRELMGNISIGKDSFYISKNDFRSPRYYNIMFGFMQKPGEKS